MTRAEFREHIEAGIAGSSNLTDIERRALRNVADNVTNVGPTYNSNPGCPATLAGLSSNERAVRQFAYAYDCSLRQAGNPYAFEVTE